MGDIVDDANKIADVHLGAALSRIKRPVPSSVTECIDCGDAIGSARKAAAPHARHCMECQGYIDKDKR